MFMGLTNMGPTWVLSAPDWLHVGPMNLTIKDVNVGLTLISCSVWQYFWRSHPPFWMISSDHGMVKRNHNGQRNSEENMSNHRVNPVSADGLPQLGATYAATAMIRLTHWGRDKMAANFLKTFQLDFLNENLLISIKMSLKFVPRGPINNILALFQIVAWRWPGDKPLSEPMMVSLLTHICVTRPQWVKAPMIYKTCHWKVNSLKPK